MCALPLAALQLAVGCAPTVPGPVLGPHADDDPVLYVPYPPPPARSEELPPQPTVDAVWVDGHYRFRSNGYEWVEGGWVMPLQGGHYAPPLVVRLRDGKLVYYEGHWHRTP